METNLVQKGVDQKNPEEDIRDDLTLLILNLNINSTEKDILEFFLSDDCGKIRNIRIIKDPKSGKSKGVAYVEFNNLESVNKATAQSGKELNGSKLTILPSQAKINKNPVVLNEKDQKTIESGKDTGESSKDDPQAGSTNKSVLPTTCILLSNLFNINDVDLKENPNFLKDLREDVEEECKKYGTIVVVFVEQTKEGNIWIKFKEGKAALAAHQAMDNRFFDGKKISCTYVMEDIFDSKFGSSL